MLRRFILALLPGIVASTERPTATFGPDTQTPLSYDETVQPGRHHLTPCSDGLLGDGGLLHRLHPEVSSERFECGLFEVPLDWAHPEHGYEQIHYARYLSAPNTEHEGTIFVEPGYRMPVTLTTSQQDWMISEAEVLHNGTQGKYDLVVWNTRGNSKNLDDLTASRQVQCFDAERDVEQFYLRASKDLGIDLPAWGDDKEFLQAQTYEDAKNWLRLQSMVVEDCVRKQNTTMLSYMGTAASVRDMVAMADFFDGPGSPINFWGIESGARVGQYLLQMFPERAGHVVLQSPQDLDAYVHNDSYETWRQDVIHTQTTLARLVDFCITPEDGNCYINFNGRVLHQDMEWALLLLINMARGMYMGWRNSAEIDLNNTVFTSAFKSAMLNNSTIEVAESLRNLQRGRIWGIFFLGLMPVYCGDKSTDYDPEVAAQRTYEIIARLENDIHFAPLIASSIVPPLEYLCHLWPVRAVERLVLDLNSDEVPTPSTPPNTGPLVVQYSDNPLARSHSLSKVVPGIQGARNLVRTKFGVDITGPAEKCVRKIIFEYLMHGEVLEHLCHDATQSDNTPHTADTGRRHTPALTWVELQREPYGRIKVAVTVLVIYAPFTMVAIFLRRRRRTPRGLAAPVVTE
ncbi:hypothetical protein GY45DRAFT_1318728 [Cubamyces sp. BRFM 1775]|nr:hypothetical protein GY45DRAFT_1318728 [Cubamyces sp. BRFM 1775]